MCEICIARQGAPEDRTAMRDGLLRNAQRMEDMAAIYRQLAYGELDPHSQKMGDKFPAIHTAIRLLVEDFL